MATASLPGGSSLEIVSSASARRAIQFSSTVAVMLHHGDADASSTNGFPLGAGTVLIVSGSLARERWTCYSSAGGMVGALEYYGVWP